MPAQASLRPSQMIALNLAGAHRKLSHFSLRIFATIPFFPLVDAEGRDSTRGWVRFLVYIPPASYQHRIDVPRKES